MLVHPNACAQTIYKYERQDGLSLTFFNKDLSQYIPHIIRQYDNARLLHSQVWGLGSDTLKNGKPAIKPPVMYLTDWEDDGNGGASPLPYNLINIGMAPMNMSYYIAPTDERYSHLFKHEYTHTVMTDRPSPRDLFWRSLFGRKVDANSEHPLSALWSWYTVPRWYAPRWYHEGIACFMETWLSGGSGRAIGGYDEMYFRSIVSGGEKISTVVGLESEGTTKDFQVGTNAYLYGTRFVNYLVYKYGYDKCVEFYSRTPDSEAFFASQFKKVYGRDLEEVWDEWRVFEVEHQKENLSVISEYPLTVTTPLLDYTFGSASPMVIDDKTLKAYTAVNYPGDFAHIEQIDLRSGEHKRLQNIDAPQLYQTSYLALDRNRGRLLWSDRNSSFRGIRTSDLQGRKSGKLSKHLNYQRVSNLVYDSTGDCLYGLFSNGGVTTIVRYDSNLENETALYKFQFGVSVSDLEVSHDGKLLVMTVTGLRGESSLIMFRTEDLADALFKYETLCELEGSNLTQFRFSADDSKLIGCSYYTGVSNLFEIDLSDNDRKGNEEDLKLLSNSRTGLFAPYLASDGRIYAYEFTRDGFVPVSMEYKVIEDCNAIEYLGQKAYEANPELATIGELKSAVPELAFGQVYDSIKVYVPLREMGFVGAYPDISGFVDKNAFNNVTPVLGYNFAFSDPVGLSTLNITLGASPWSSNDWKNRFHASADFRYMNWRFNASWNPTSFYDLFGPARRSRKGYNIGFSYRYAFSFRRPFEWHWSVGANHYGGMDALPLYQNVTLDEGIKSFQTASATIGMSKTRSSLGGIQAEQGYALDLAAYTYLAGGKLFPSLNLKYDQGVLLPVMRNTSFWLRSAVGQNFGDPESSLGNQYFGGFRNNYIDNGTIYRYRDISAMPGLRIDDVKARSFIKETAEVNLQPLRFSNTGWLGLYPTYGQLTLFATDLIANPWGKQTLNNFVSVGAQFNVEIVLFNYMKTTWSIGFAHCLSPQTSGLKPHSNELLLSLKLL